MIKMNQKMKHALHATEWTSNELPETLSNLAVRGFIEHDECFFLASTIEKKTNISSSDFPDKTGYECFINSIHIDDHIQSDYLINACLLAETILKKLSMLEKNQLLRIIISSNEFGATLKVHLLRTGESWLASNLEEYDEAILFMDSIDYCSSKASLKTILLASETP